MSRIGFIFPGQGSQYQGMGKDFYERYDEVKRLFSLVEEVLNFDVKEVCFNREDLLKQTQYTQSMVFLISVCCLHIARMKGINPVIVAGHSLGEYSALYAAGVLNFEDSLSLVYKRGLFMHEASVKNKGAMAAIVGLGENEVRDILRSFSSDELVLANYNLPQQCVISGKIECIEKARELAENRGAKRVVILNVEGAFHSPFMQEAREKLSLEIEKTSFNPPNIPVVFNVNGEVVNDPSEIKRLLIEQVTGSVLWVNCMEKMLAAGTDVFVEVGPNKVLGGMLRRFNREIKVYNIEDEQSLVKTYEGIFGG